MSATNSGNIEIEVPSGDTVNVPSDETVEVVSLKRGPYKGYVVVSADQEGLQVYPPIHVEKTRPAILDAEDFFEFDKMTEAASKLELKEKL